MHILTLILMFVIGSIIAACKGDLSGLEAIVKIIVFLVFFFVMLWLLAYHPFLTGFCVIAIFVIIFILAFKDHK